ncbi:MAG: hypothetical protein R2832_17965 [Rhodothermales bacterium]
MSIGPVTFHYLRCTLVVVALAALALVPLREVSGQSRDYRQSRTYAGVGVGVYTFHGPVDLWKPRSEANFVRKKDPAFLANIQFPLTRERLYLRPQIGYTAADREYGTRILISGENEFIVNDLLWLEGNLVLMLRSPRHRVLPYLFGGVGYLLADPFGRTTAHRESIPAAHVKRTQFYFPVGAGVDLAMSRKLSLYVETGLRLSRNSVFIDRAEPDPFNTTLITAGLRFALGHRPVPPPDLRLDNFCPVCPVCEVCAPIVLPVIVPEESCCACAIEDLQTVYFAGDAAVLSASARASLDENIEALSLRQNQDCSLMVAGFYDDGEDSEIAARRAALVLSYYVDGGISSDRLKTGDIQPGGASCGTKPRARVCAENRRVVTQPYCGFGPICPRPEPPPRYSPLQDDN